MRSSLRLGSCVRASDTVARLGGDEFAVILENLRDTDDEGAQQVAEKMIASMAAPLLIEGQALTTSCSIGISLFPADGRDSATLMKNADVAAWMKSNITQGADEWNNDGALNIPESNRDIAGPRILKKTVAKLGHGGILTRSQRFRFPPYARELDAPEGEGGGGAAAALPSGGVASEP